MFFLRGYTEGKHMKGCSRALAIREIQIETIVRFHCTPIRTAKWNIMITPNASKDAEKLGSIVLLVGMENCTLTQEKILIVPFKTKRSLTTWPEWPF